MSSTRLKNEAQYYKCEQKQMDAYRSYRTYEGRGTPANIGFPQEGINMGPMPNLVLSKNAVDIDSYLKGINTNNLVNPQAAPVPQINQMNQIDFYAKCNKVILPKPLTIEDGQRFYALNK
jgi:hypothetical protein